MSFFEEAIPDGINVSLTRLEGGSALRTYSVNGRCLNLPEEGQQFSMMTAPLEGGTFRLVSTSIVKVLEQRENEYFLTTESGSRYHVQVVN